MLLGSEKWFKVDQHAGPDALSRVEFEMVTNKSGEPNRPGESHSPGDGPVLFLPRARIGVPENAG